MERWRIDKRLKPEGISFHKSINLDVMELRKFVEHAFDNAIKDLVERRNWVGWEWKRRLDIREFDMWHLRR